MEVCPAWMERRRVLTQAIGDDLSLEAVVRVMVTSEKAWRAVADFCEMTMATKEEKERERRRDRRRMPPTSVRGEQEDFAWKAEALRAP